MPPRPGFGVEFETFDLRITLIIGQMGRTHAPVVHVAAYTDQTFKVRQGKEEATNDVCAVNHDGIVRYTAESLAGLASLVETIGRKVDRVAFSAGVARAALNGDSHELARITISSDQVDPGMIYTGALKTVL